jgi:hypothetical protein
MAEGATCAEDRPLRPIEWCPVPAATAVMLLPYRTRIILRLPSRAEGASCATKVDHFFFSSRTFRCHFCDGTRHKFGDFWGRSAPCQAAKKGKTLRHSRPDSADNTRRQWQLQCWGGEGTMPVLLMERLLRVYSVFNVDIDSFPGNYERF